MSVVVIDTLSAREVSTRILRERRWPLLLGFLVFAGVAAWTFLATPRYRSTALLRIESKSSAMPAIPDQLQSLPGLGLSGLGKDDLETEVGVLRSERIVDAAIDSLALYVRVKQPAEDRAAAIRARVVAPVDVDGKLTFTREKDGRYAVSSSRLEAYHLPPFMSPGDSIRIGGLMLILPPSLRVGGADRIKLELLPRYKVRERMDSRLTIRKQEGGSRLVEVAFEDPDRVLAAQVISTMVAEYVAYTLRTDKGDVSSTVGELQGAIARNATQLAASEDMLRAFQQRQLIILPDEQAAAQVKRIGLLDTRVDAVRIERSALARLLALIADRSRGGKDVTAYRQLATFPSLITNRAIQDLLQALIELENKRSELGVRVTDQAEDYRALSARIAELDRQLYQTGSQYLESLDHQLTSTIKELNVLTDTLQALPATAMQYARLVRNRTVESETYLMLQKQLKLAQLQDLMRKEKVRVVDAPRVAHPDDPAFPKPKVQLALGAVLAVVVALTVGFLGVLFAGPVAPVRDPL